MVRNVWCQGLIKNDKVEGPTMLKEVINKKNNNSTMSKEKKSNQAPIISSDGNMFHYHMPSRS